MSHKINEEVYEHPHHNDICELKKELLSRVKSEIGMVGLDQMDTAETGQVIDMIKDLAEAEKCCMEACYYHKIIKAMEESEEDRDGDWRMGYNPRHYANGRFAPRGKGMGYTPEMRQYPYLYAYMNDPEFIHEMENRRLGYQNSGAGNRSQSGRRMGHEDEDWNSEYDPMHSREYNEYRKAKRHYTESKSPSDKQKMDEHAVKHMNQAIDSFREMWADADPNMRKKMKADLTKLVGEMPI